MDTSPNLSIENAMLSGALKAHQEGKLFSTVDSTYIEEEEAFSVLEELIVSAHGKKRKKKMTRALARFKKARKKVSIVTLDHALAHFSMCREMHSQQ